MTNDASKLKKYKPTGLSVIGSFGALIASIFGMIIGLRRLRDRHTSQAKGFIYSVQCIPSEKKCKVEARYTADNKVQKIMLESPDPSPFSTNQEITVYYNPQNVTDAVVEAPSKTVALAILVFSIIVFLNIGWYLYNQYQIYKVIKDLF